MLVKTVGGLLLRGSKWAAEESGFVLRSRHDVFRGGLILRARFILRLVCVCATAWTSKMWLPWWN